MYPASPAPRSPSALAIGLCAALLLLVGLSQRIVVCTHLDGDSHVEFAHAAGDCCRDPAAPPLFVPAGDHGNAELGRLETCSHTDLTIELAPAPRPDQVPPTDLNTPVAHAVVALPPLGAPRASTARPPATGPPPRPPAFLAHRRSTLLLL